MPAETEERSASLGSPSIITYPKKGSLRDHMITDHGDEKANIDPYDILHAKHEMYHREYQGGVLDFPVVKHGHKKPANNR